MGRMLADRPSDGGRSPADREGRPGPERPQTTLRIAGYPISSRITDDAGHSHRLAIEVSLQSGQINPGAAESGEPRQFTDPDDSRRSPAEYRVLPQEKNVRREQSSVRADERRVRL